MKKNYCLLFASIFALSSCSSEITIAQASDVATDIRDYVYDVNSVSTLKFKSNKSVHVKGTLNRAVVDEKIETTSTCELSSRFNYIHFFTKKSETDKVEGNDSPTENEMWIYMKRKVLYVVQRNKSKGQELKYYSKNTNYSDAIKEFSHLFDYTAFGVIHEARNTKYLDSSIIFDYLDKTFEYDVEYAGKYFSSKKGNLKIINAVKCDGYKYEGIPAKMVGAISCKWNKYLIKNAKIALTVNATDGTNKNDLKYTVACSETTSNFVIPTRPNLSSYAERSSNTII